MIRYPNEAERSLGFPQFYGARNERNKNLERQVQRMSMRNKKAGRSWQKQAAGYPFRDTAVQKANDQYWKNCTTIRTVNFTHRARRGA